MATNKFKDILVKEEISIGELARASSISAVTLNKFAICKRTPSPGTAYKILNALKKFKNISKQYTINEIFPTVKAVH